MKVPEIKKIIREYNTIKIKLTQKKGDLVNALDTHLKLEGEMMKWKNDSPFKDERPAKKITDIVAVEGTDRTLKEKLPPSSSLKKTAKSDKQLKKLRRQLLSELKKLRESKKEPTLPQALLYNKYKTELSKNKIKPKDDKVAVEFVRVSKERMK
jgi:hypothetical protein